MGRGYSLYDIEQFMREAGAERVTEDAVLDLERELERLTEKIAHKALRYAEHAGRKKVIRRADVLLTSKADEEHIQRRPRALMPKASRTKSISTTHM